MTLKTVIKENVANKKNIKKDIIQFRKYVTYFTPNVLATNTMSYF